VCLKASLAERASDSSDTKKFRATDISEFPFTIVVPGTRPAIVDSAPTGFVSALLFPEFSAASSRN
jgi:hypothetical protein